MKLQRLWTAMAILGAGLAAGVSAQQPRQPIGELLNASIEQMDEQERPLNWTLEGGGRGARGGGGGGAVDRASFRGGSNSLRLDGSGRWNNPTLVKPYATYKLSGWIKTADLPTTGGVGATLQVGTPNMNVTSPAESINGTRDWTPVELTFETGGEDSVTVGAAIASQGGRGRGRGRGRGQGPAPSAGTAWFDDLKLELVSARELRPSVTIDASRTREQMSDHIYGQFIEHLGRCIYGGIWAEMLEDRKFWYPVDTTVEAAAEGGGRRGRGGRGGQRGAAARGPVNPAAQILFRPINASPWLIVGGEGAVTMLTREANPAQVYVGDQTPQVDLGAGGTAKGIVQNNLALIAGKGYEGRVILAGDETAAPIEVSLIWGDGPSERQTVRIGQVGSEYVKYPFRFTAGESTENGKLEIVGRGRGKFMIGTSSIMPDDNFRGMRVDTLAALKELDSPIYRWPGGNFVSGYDWKDGLGDVDKRPPRKNPAWTGVEHNDFGMHEFFDFLAEVKSEPFIALNAGLGSAESAAQEVEYVNGGPDTPMGRLRVANGGPAQPWHCTYWAVGNEMSGGWQLGNVPLEEFIARHNEFSQGLMKVDPSIKLIASGEATNGNVNRWDQQLLAGAADTINLNSKHFYMQDYRHAGGLMSHVRLIPDSIRRIAESHRRYLETIPEIQGKEIKVSLDEWNYWYGPHVFGELGTRYFFRDGLGIAAGINEFTRATDVITLAAYAQTVNVIGAIKTTKTAAVLDSTGMALAMYRKHFGYIPVEVTGAPEPLEVAATLTKDRRALTISVVNPTYDTQRLAFNVRGVQPASSGTAWVLASNDDMNYNQPGESPKVTYTEKAVTGIGNTLEVAPATATIFVLPLR